MHVLFVCTGNVCRSVIAERLTRAIAAEHGLDDLTAESAGTRALVGFGVEPLAAQTITGLGGCAENFKARRLKPELVERADLVLAMTEQIRDDIAGLVPDAAGKIFTLLEAYRIAKVSGARTIAEIDRARNDLTLVGRENIADPVGLSAEKYCEVGDRIAEALVPLLVALHIHEGQGSDDRGRPRLVVLPGGRSETPTSTASPRIGRHA
ncbi:low molecular weight phosphatase family protein [Nocardia terpenica]|uniref:Protein tyrosine phosphatase n=1 Tax=Nocardia terpenica TaxID=455432 RepID=A0A164MTE4_9NOCA|nr:protein tyrosine phosphatase [Nocardia terpenica]KZM73646.1 protein tyrosine phosphatase [Nocardia terpenica]MBF6066235.1 low molecular weight phosphatase family protein [Nocardia terpenica]MBF6109347.1 low molecular weight phosphatase family protein [Nocardia terpenica]MBF6116533.1 low molecular weight phosphatase family protein [Nocardia terpenica]MBF6123648.1 low molecular weight phosphatase family protein [Nocardia terpenica]